MNISYAIRPRSEYQVSGKREEINADPDPCVGPAVSVVMPNFNLGHRGLENAIESVLAQTFTDWELIIVDDGSTDGSDRVADWYAANDSRIRFVRQEHHSVSAARNRAFYLANGIFVAFLDGDDEWLPNKLELQMAELKANPYAGVSFGFRRKSGEVGLNWGDWEVFETPWDVVCERCYPPAQSVVVRRSIIQAVGGQDAAHPLLRNLAQDWDLWVRAFAVTRDASFVMQPLYELHFWEDSITANAIRTGNGKIANAVVQERIARIGGALEKLGERKTKIVHVVCDGNMRGLQGVANNIAIYTDPDQYEVVMSPLEMKGDYIAQWQESFAVEPWQEKAAELCEWADIIHVHYSGHNYNIPSGLGDKLLVTEHSVLNRWSGEGRKVTVWRERKVNPAQSIVLEFNPPAIEIPNPCKLAKKQDPIALPDGPVVLAICPAQHYKGIDLIIEAFAKITDKLPEAVCVVVGVRENEDHLYQDLIQRVAELSQSGKKILVLPPVNREGISGLLERASVLLHLSRTESFGLAVCEAQMAGVPVVASAVGGIPQALKFGKLVCNGQATAAANAVVKLLRSKAKAPKGLSSEFQWRHDPRRATAAYCEVYKWIRLNQIIEGEQK